MSERTNSRSQNAYAKRRSKKDGKFKTKSIVTKDNTPKYVEKKFIDREKGKESKHYLIVKYGVSKHCAERFLERVFGQETEHSQGDLEKAAQMIVKNVDKAAFEIGVGEYPLFDGFKIVMRNSVAITVVEYNA